MKRQREFGDILMSSDIKQVPICGMTFGSMDHLPRQTAAVSDNNELVPVIQNCSFTANISRTSMNVMWIRRSVVMKAKIHYTSFPVASP